MKLLNSAWSFLAIYQDRYMRLLHIVVLISVIIQILISNWMIVPVKGSDRFTFYTFCTWFHISLGLLNIILTPLFIIYCFNKKGMMFFFPYLFKHTSCIKDDVLTLLKFRLPPMGSQGLASSVEGLGLGALLLALLTGFIWFILWCFNLKDSSLFLNLHKSLTVLIEIFIVGHGSMAILHFLYWKRSRKG